MVRAGREIGLMMLYFRDAKGRRGGTSVLIPGNLGVDMSKLVKLQEAYVG